MIQVKRAYDAPSSADGVRFLVDRLWPRGVTKASLGIRAWLKDAAPSHDLRKRFHHDPAQWGEFCRHYFAELRESPASWAPILEAARAGTVTLIYGARDSEHNNAIALKEFLSQRLRAKDKH
jgi:uncharacterized protein YeaO (DUF488 family)